MDNRLTFVEEMLLTTCASSSKYWLNIEENNLDMDVAIDKINSGEEVKIKQVDNGFVSIDLRKITETRKAIKVKYPDLYKLIESEQYTEEDADKWLQIVVFGYINYKK